MLICYNKFFQFFKVKINDNVNEELLMGTIKDIAERSTLPAKPVGILTGTDRDTWAEVHKKLIGFLLSFCCFRI